ncbi:hypothetical protein PGT21_006278 [Puccinia graminis f. sp. tritici]|uniref:Uncharacterized protein n=1 Tax=Puccinia graminis f. sp. tritici TaxID=56615 RepID=A0A5B0S8L9_PUCGR|nr:hypothetical protein PGT21_006278 [Puccinia graminis f. sp. tritici]KAA1134218.1 hypothetical protein PGTUg99_032915 [Puccinia graminis f. sp. tritici]
MFIKALGADRTQLLAGVVRRLNDAVAPERMKHHIHPMMVDGFTIPTPIPNEETAAITQQETTATGNEEVLNGLALVYHVEIVANDVLPIKEDCQKLYKSYIDQL